MEFSVFHSLGRSSSLQTTPEPATTNNSFYFPLFTYTPTLLTPRKRIDPVFPQHKLNLAVHVLVVDGLAALKVDTAPGLERLLVEPRAPELVEDFLFAQDPVQHPAGLLDVVVLHQHRPGDKLGVTHFAFFLLGLVPLCFGCCVKLDWRRSLKL